MNAKEREIKLIKSKKKKENEKKRAREAKFRENSTFCLYPA